MPQFQVFYLRHVTLIGTCCSTGAEILVSADVPVDSALQVYVPAWAYETDVIFARVFKLPWFVWYVSILALYENISILNTTCIIRRYNTNFIALLGTCVKNNYPVKLAVVGVSESVSSV